MSRDMNASEHHRMVVGRKLRLAVVMSGVLGAAALLGGCATGSERFLLNSQPSSDIDSRAEQQWLSDTPICCSALTQLPWRVVSSQASLVLEFTKDTPVYDFSTGKSPFHALILPRGQGPLKLHLESDVVRSDQGQLSVFVPQVLLLDEQGSVLRRIKAQDIVYRPARGLAPDRMTVDIALTPEIDGQRVIIATTPATLKTTTEILHPSRAQARARNLAEPQVENAQARHALMGRIHVRISRLSDSQGLLAPLLGSGQVTTISAEAINAQAMPVSLSSDLESQSSIKDTVVMEASGSRSADASPSYDFDYKRMIRAALTAGDISLALALADRAEQEGEHGTRQWLASQLRTKE